MLFEGKLVQMQMSLTSFQWKHYDKVFWQKQILGWVLDIDNGTYKITVMNLEVIFYKLSTVVMESV